MSISECKKLTDQKKSWAPYSVQLRTGQNANTCQTIKCFQYLKEDANQLMKVGHPIPLSQEQDRMPMIAER